MLRAHPSSSHCHLPSACPPILQGAWPPPRCWRRRCCPAARRPTQRFHSCWLRRCWGTWQAWRCRPGCSWLCTPSWCAAPRPTPARRCSACSLAPATGRRCRALWPGCARVLLLCLLPLLNAQFVCLLRGRHPVPLLHMHVQQPPQCAARPLQDAGPGWAVGIRGPLVFLSGRGDPHIWLQGEEESTHGACVGLCKPGCSSCLQASVQG